MILFASDWINRKIGLYALRLAEAMQEEELE